MLRSHVIINLLFLSTFCKLIIQVSKKNLRHLSYTPGKGRGSIPYPIITSNFSENYHTENFQDLKSFERFKQDSELENFKSGRLKEIHLRNIIIHSCRTSATR